MSSGPGGEVCGMTKAKSMDGRAGSGVARPVLFLDVDGVLNYEKLIRERGDTLDPLCPHCCARLDCIVETTGCHIVLSSSWRGHPNLERRLREAGVLRRGRRHKHWRTPRHRDGVYMNRGGEIAEWLSKHPEVTVYAIVDDDEDMLPEQRHRLVR